MKSNILLMRFLSGITDRIIIVIVFIISLTSIFGSFNAAYYFGIANSAFTSEVTTDYKNHMVNEYFIRIYLIIGLYHLIQFVYYSISEIYFKRTIGKSIFKLIHTIDFDSNITPKRRTFIYKNILQNSIYVIIGLVFIYALKFEHHLIISVISFIVCTTPILFKQHTTLSERITGIKTQINNTNKIKNNIESSLINFINAKKKIGLFAITYIFFTVFILNTVTYNYYRYLNEKNKFNWNYYYEEISKSNTNFRSWYNSFFNFQFNYGIDDHSIYNRKLDSEKIRARLIVSNRKFDIIENKIKNRATEYETFHAIINFITTTYTTKYNNEFIYVILKRNGMPKPFEFPIKKFNQSKAEKDPKKITYPYPFENHLQEYGISNSMLIFNIKKNPLRNFFITLIAISLIVSIILLSNFYFQSLLRNKNALVLYISIIVTAFLSTNFYLRYYLQTYKLYLYESQELFFKTLFCFIIIYMPIFFYIEKWMLKNNLSFNNSKLNKLYFVIAIIMSTFNEIKFLFLSNFSFSNQYINIFQFKMITNIGQSYGRIESLHFNGILILLFLSASYYIVFWILNDNKNNKSSEQVKDTDNIPES